MKTLEISFTRIATGFAVVAIFLSASFAHGMDSHKLPSFVRVLSYNEVMRLSKPKRQAYIRGLRAMMKEIDRLPKKLRVSNDVDSRSSQIAALLSLLSVDEAEAASGVPVSRNGVLKCDPPLQTYMAVRRVVGVQIEPKAICIQGEPQSSKCPSSTIGVLANAGEGTWRCATLSSFNLIPDNTKARLRKVPNGGDFLMNGVLGFGSAKSKFLNGQPTAEFFSARWEKANRPHLQIQLVDPNKTVTAPPPAPSAASVAQAEERARVARERLAARGVRVGTGTTSPARAGNAEARATTAPPESRAPQQPQATNYQAVDNDGSNAIVVTPVVPREELATGPEVSDETEDTSTQASAQFGSCEPQAEKSCDASKIEDARLKYASDPNPDCIYAGSISTYQDGKKRAFKCVAPSKFCFGSTTCTNSTGESLQADYSCESGQVICNPLIFGVHSDGQSPFCIEKTAQATASCDDESKSDDGAVTPLDQEHAGLKEAWNDFADRLFKLCNQNKIAADLHCAECDIISKRLFALNIAARDIQNCGAAIKFEDSQCDADGKCRGLPGQRSTGRARAVTENVEPAEGDFPETGTKRFGIRGNREVSSVKEKAWKTNVHSMSDVKPAAQKIESVFDTPTSRPK